MTSRCPCCGQSIAVASQAPTVWVEEDVLAFCNRAYERAEESGAAEVELRHLVEAFEASYDARQELSRFGVDMALLIEMARRSASSGLAGSGERPRTSHALRTLLQRAEVRAKTERQQSVTLALVIATLLIDMRDIAAAAFISPALSQRAAMTVSQATATPVWQPPRQLRLPLESETRSLARSTLQHGAPLRGPAETMPRHAATTQFARNGDGGQGGYTDRQSAWERRPPQHDGGTADRDLEMQRLLGRFDAQSRVLTQLQRQLELLSAEFGINTRSHRRFFRKRRSSSSLSRYFRRKSVSVNGSRATRTRAARTADLTSQASLIETDQPEPDVEDDTDDETPLTARPKRFYLALEDDIVKAPSIGPRTAAKLQAVGAMLVRDLLLADADELSAALQTRYITPQRVAAWQAQARLVCTIPWLRGTHAQMLVGAGFDTLDKVQKADREKLCAAVQQFAGTRDGQSVLRSSPPPESARVARWAEFAQLAERDRAGAHAYTH